jgi:hypothetical protein
VGELGDEGSDQYRVGEEREHGMRVPPMPYRSPMATSFKPDIVPLAPAPDEKHEGRVAVGALLPRTRKPRTLGHGGWYPPLSVKAH